ncbi:helix-turn-helix transcriptional regulator [Cellulomonas alba]|uniref:Helix-turn-helix domain-containing protein n=1 Tax=Cellulomonas alba TaxID=3053467 RepID=A0ABT7SD86_9CELL|nr:helix-turn-helix domain-containing protein [Cellulomonas alba]MDM7854145.1 helix-turn-helix domain-containing protein [Cellulomonas alba]
MDLASRAAAIGALADPVRRALYQHVVAQPDGVGREQAAAAVGVPAHTAKFHLERLADEGLLDVEFRRLSGRTGPGAGRPAKLYRRARSEVTVSLPERRYDLVGDILATALEQVGEGAKWDTAVQRAARAEGVRAGDAARAAAGGATAGPEPDRLAGALEQHGYEPRVEGSEIVLTNCPFDALAQRHTALVCGLNVDYVQGVADGLECADAHARLAPAPGLCCVRVGTSGQA